MDPKIRLGRLAGAIYPISTQALFDEVGRKETLQRIQFDGTSLFDTYTRVLLGDTVLEQSLRLKSSPQRPGLFLRHWVQHAEEEHGFIAALTNKPTEIHHGKLEIVRYMEGFTQTLIYSHVRWAFGRNDQLQDYVVWDRSDVPPDSPVIYLSFQEPEYSGNQAVSGNATVVNDFERPDGVSFFYSAWNQQNENVREKAHYDLYYDENKREVLTHALSTVSPMEHPDAIEFMDILGQTYRFPQFITRNDILLAMEGMSIP